MATTTYITYGHVEDETTRLVCEGQSAAPEHIDHCLQHMRDCLNADLENEDVTDEVWNVREEAHIDAGIAWEDFHNTDATIAAIRRYWDV